MPQQTVYVASVHQLLATENIVSIVIVSYFEETILSFSSADTTKTSTARQGAHRIEGFAIITTLSVR